MKKLIIVSLFLTISTFAKQIVVKDNKKLCKVGDLVGWLKDNPIFTCKQGTCIMDNKSFWLVCDDSYYKTIKSKYKCKKDK